MPYSIAALHAVPCMTPPLDALSAAAHQQADALAGSLRKDLMLGRFTHLTAHDRGMEFGGPALGTAARRAPGDWLPSVLMHIKVLGDLAREVTRCGVAVPSYRLHSAGQLEAPLAPTSRHERSSERLLDLVPMGIPVPRSTPDCWATECMHPVGTPVETCQDALECFPTLTGPHAHLLSAEVPPNSGRYKNFYYYRAPLETSQVYIATSGGVPKNQYPALQLFMRDLLRLIARPSPNVPVVALARIGEQGLREVAERAVVRDKLAQDFWRPDTASGTHEP